MKNILLLVMLSLASCQKKQAPSQKETQHTSYSPDSIVLPPDIITVDTLKIKDYRAVIANVDYPALNLSKEEVAKADALLYKSLNTYNKKPERDDINLRYYVRQYVPQINDKGEKEVVIYAMCGVPGDGSWRKHISHINDGGDCFFEVLINLDKNTVSELWPHGQA